MNRDQFVEEAHSYLGLSKDLIKEYVKNSKKYKFTTGDFVDCERWSNRLRPSDINITVSTNAVQTQ